MSGNTRLKTIADKVNEAYLTGREAKFTRDDSVTEHEFTPDGLLKYYSSTQLTPITDEQKTQFLNNFGVNLESILSYIIDQSNKTLEEKTRARINLGLPLRFATRDDAISLGSLLSSQTSIEIEKWDTASVLCLATYSAVASEPAHEGKFFAGTWFELSSPIINPDMLGAKNDSAISSSEAIQRAADVGFSRGGNYVIEFSPRYYRSDLPVVFKGTRATVRGYGRTSVIGFGRMGAALKGITIEAPLQMTMDSLRFEGTGGARHKRHPIGIYAPNNSRCKFSHLEFGGLGNTPIWISRPFNCDIDDIDIFTSGYAPLHKEIPTTTLITVGLNSTSVSTNADVFDVGDVNKQIILNMPPGQFIAKITAVDGPRAATIERGPPLAISNAVFGFCPVMGSMVAGSTELNFESSVLDVDDLNRLIYVHDADTNQQVLVSRIVQVISPTKAVLQHPAVNTVTSERISFTPQIYSGGFEATSTANNDIVFSRINIENYLGPAYIIQNGTHVFLNNIKTHGASIANPGSVATFGRAGESMIMDSVSRMSIDNWQLELGNAKYGRGQIQLSGLTPRMVLDALTVNGPCFGNALIDFRPGTPDDSWFVKGTLQVPYDLTMFYPSLILARSEEVARNIYASGPTIGLGFLETASNQHSGVFGSIRSGKPPFISGNGGTYSFTPATKCGYLFVMAEGNSFHGVVYFNMLSGASIIQKMLGPNGFTTTAGTAASYNVTCNGTTGKITIENTTGTGRRTSYSILG